MRYFLGFLIIIGLLIIGVIVFIRLVFGGNDTTDTSNEKTTLSSLVGANKTVKLTVDQPINADQVHRQTTIEVGESQTTLRLITGYENIATKTETYSNNSASYGSFLQALDAAGFTNGNKESKLTDERGYCPQGKRYVFEIKDGATSTQRYWSTSCGDKSNFQGDTPTLLRLFKAQVPSYQKSTSGLQGYGF